MKRKLIYIISIIIVNIIVFYGVRYNWFISICSIHEEIMGPNMSKFVGFAILIVLLPIWELINFGLYELSFRDYEVNKMYIKVPMAIILIFNLFMDILVIGGFINILNPIVF